MYSLEIEVSYHKKKVLGFFVVFKSQVSQLHLIYGKNYSALFLRLMSHYYKESQTVGTHSAIQRR